MSTPEPAVVAATSEDFRLAEQRFEPSGVVLSASGELDIVAAPVIRERLTAAVDAGARRLVLDLTGVDFMDSVALAAVLHARRHLGEDGRLAVAITPGSYVRLVFEIAGLPRCLDIFETRDAALAALKD